MHSPSIIRIHSFHPFEHKPNNVHKMHVYYCPFCDMLQPGWLLKSQLLEHIQRWHLAAKEGDTNGT